MTHAKGGLVLAHFSGSLKLVIWLRDTKLSHVVRVASFNLVLGIFWELIVLFVVLALISDLKI